jgi:heptosyltransferase II
VSSILGSDGPYGGEGYATDCRLFTGFSPCRHRRACAGCRHYEPVGTRILLVVLDALGDVLRSTAVLPAIRRRHPRAHITWLTRRASAPLLANNPLVDRILVLGEATTAVLGALRFDIALCSEKSVPAGALMRLVRAEDKRGFTVDDGGAIVPLGPAAEYLYRLGLDNEAKFFHNSRSEQQVVTEALGFEYARDRYVVVLNDAERRWAKEDRRSAGVGDDEILVGWNTGCSPRYAYKKLTVDDQVELMDMTWELLPRKDKVRFVLLGGGREDEERNDRIAEQLAQEQIPVARTPARHGVRRGLASTAACDMVVSGDTLGLHMAIGLKKPVVTWFGITCHQEIDLYGRGVKVLSEVSCRPCWLQSCHLEPKCFRTLPWQDMASVITEMAVTLLREGSWKGERLIGDFPPRNRTKPPLGVSPGPVV